MEEEIEEIECSARHLENYQMAVKAKTQKSQRLEDSKNVECFLPNVSGEEVFAFGGERSFFEMQGIQWGLFFLFI